MTTPIETIRATITTVREAESRGGSPSYMEGRAIDALNDNASVWLAELCDRAEAAETDVVDARLSIAQLCDVRDGLRRNAESAEAKLAEVERIAKKSRETAEGFGSALDHRAATIAKHEATIASLERSLLDATARATKAEAERDDAIAERDARPSVSAEDLRLVKWDVWSRGEDDCEASERVEVALRAHAKASGGEHV